ncbi:MAG: hypothetical protein WC886_07440 [Saccharofermentanaceae bacterium]|jgi:hypothetical protein
MKKQTKIIIGVVIALAVVIIAISFMFPTVFTGLTSGTFGKADKYHKTQMTEKDIMLRSELVSDTGKLRSMIQGLIYFSLFTEDVSNKIDSCIDAYKAQGICTDPDKCASMSALQDFSDFIKNNNKTLRTTISMLTGFYLKDQSDESADVEKNLRDFGTYVVNLNEKDSILNQALRTLDNYLLTTKTLKNKKEELANLKSIRDQLLISGIQLSGMLQDKPLCGTLCSYALSSQSQMNALMKQEGFGKVILVGAQQKLNMANNQGKLENAIINSQISFGSALQIGEIIEAQKLGIVVESKGADLGAALQGQLQVIIYNRPDLQFVVGNIAELQKVLSSQQMSALLSGQQQFGAIKGVAIFSNQGLNLYQSAYNLQNVMQSQELSSMMNANQLNIILSQQSIGSFAYSSNFIGIQQELNNMGLNFNAAR